MTRAQGLRPTTTTNGSRHPAAVRRSRGKIPSFGNGRVCAWPGCDTTLSRYNGATLCWIHDRPPDR